MFNSQKISHDREPFIVAYQGVDKYRVSQERADSMYSRRYENGFGETVTVTYSPRPEFGQNNPNPLLEMIRSGEAEIGPTLEWIHKGTPRAYQFPGLTIHHVHHARKVLTRLANKYIAELGEGK